MEDLDPHVLEALRARFHAQCEATATGCVRWLGGTSHGHARCHLLLPERAAFAGRRDVSAHLVAWFLAHGTVCKFIDRTCGNTLCVAVAHLEERTQATRFWRNVDQRTTPDGCWPWKGGKHTFGYGSTTHGSAHRVAYELTHGKIQNDALVRHTCHNPICCRPDHLVLGTQLDNVHDAITAGRMNYVRGERSPRSAFTDDQANAIREVFTAMQATRTPQNALLAQLARALNVNTRTVWRVVKGLSYAPVEPLKNVDRIIRDVRKNGFPWDAIYDHEDDVLTAVRLAKINITTDTVKYISPTGQATCLQAYPHRFAASHKGQLSVVAAFHDDRTLARAIRYQLQRNEPTAPARIVRALQALVRAPRNFPPVLARWIVDQYVPSNGVVLDPCTGYGGRLLGACASAQHVSYIGYDIDAQNITSGQQLAEQLQVASRVQLQQRAVEDPQAWPDADLVFTSPPYFNVESYSDAARLQFASYASYEDWLRGFLRTLIARALQSAPLLILNVAKTGGYDLPADATRIVQAHGGRLARTVTWPLQRFGKYNTEEKILVFEHR